MLSVSASSPRKANAVTEKSNLGQGKKPVRWVPFQASLPQFPPEVLLLAGFHGKSHPWVF